MRLYQGGMSWQTFLRFTSLKLKSNSCVRKSSATPRQKSHQANETLGGVLMGRRLLSGQGVRSEN
jgi:hypothetical protein